MTIFFVFKVTSQLQVILQSSSPMQNNSNDENKHKRIVIELTFKFLIEFNNLFIYVEFMALDLPSLPKKPYAKIQK